MDEQQKISATDRALMFFMSMVMFFGVLAYLTGKSAPADPVAKLLGIGMMGMALILLLISVKPDAPTEKRKNEEKRKNDDVINDGSWIVYSQDDVVNFYFEHEQNKSSEDC